MLGNIFFIYFIIFLSPHLAKSSYGWFPFEQKITKLKKKRKRKEKEKKTLRGACLWLFPCNFPEK
jgi:hypothetical protein